MSEENQGENDEGRVTLSADDLKALREKAKEADRLVKEHSEAQRELAFVKAKIDITDPKMGYFVKGYDGDMSAEAIRAEAEKVGLLAGAPQVPQNELNAHQRMGEAAAGAESGAPFDFQAELAKCKTNEEVMALATRQNMPTTWNRPS